MRHFREPVNGITHALGAVLGLLGWAWMVYLTRANLPYMLAVCVFGGSMVILYSASTAMHLYNGSERVLHGLRQFDHAAIYILIAGTYTPFLVILLAGAWQWGMLALVWGLALLGVLSKTLFFHDGHLSTLGYVVMGLFPALLAVGHVQTAWGAASLWFLAGGGVLYLSGALVFALQKPNLHRYFGHHELWHVFVLGGNSLHFMSVLVLLWR